MGVTARRNTFLEKQGRMADSMGNGWMHHLRITATQRASIASPSAGTQTDSRRSVIGGDAPKESLSVRTAKTARRRHCVASLRDVCCCSNTIATKRRYFLFHGSSRPPPRAKLRGVEQVLFSAMLRLDYGRAFARFR